MNISVYLFILLQISLWCTSQQKSCLQSLKSKTAVERCPYSKDEWDRAAQKKNCENLASRQTCTPPDNFKYHCVINSYRNETVEVCAPAKIILGHCTEFNDKGGIIQMQRRSPCNNSGFPKCEIFYKSSDAYKFQDCYMLVQKTHRNTSTSVKTETSTTDVDNKADVSAIPEETESGDLSTVTIVIISIPLLALIVGVFLLIYKKRERERLEDLEEQIPLFNFKEKFDLKKQRRKNIDKSKAYLIQNETIDQYFVETQAYGKGREVFYKYGIVIWTGPPGCGKTQTAIHLILKQIGTCEFRRISSPHELSYVENDKETLILLDNIFFQQDMDLVKIWWNKLGSLHKRCFESSGNESAFSRVRLVITARENVIERACTFMGNTTPILNDNHRINANILTGMEKDKIFFNQQSFAKVNNFQNPDVSEDFLKKIKESEGPIGFPLCAHLYLFSDEYKNSGVKFFSQPIEYLKLQIEEEIKKDKTNRTKSLFIVLFFREWQTKMANPQRIQINDANECRQLLENVGAGMVRNMAPLNFGELENEAQRLVGGFLKEENDGMYTFIHDSVYEAVGAFLCETYVTETAMFFPIDIIQTQKYANTTEKQQDVLVTRLISEAIDNQNISKVFACRLFQQPWPGFTRLFLSKVEQFNRKKLRKFFTVVNSSSPVKLPCLFWTSFYNLTKLTEKFYLIISKSDINPDYQLYLSLYGERCAGNESLLNSIDSTLHGNLEELKRRVLCFGQKEDKPILHLVISSERSDEFAASIVEKLLHDEIPVDIRNKRNLTPLMSAVNQRQQRTKVITKLIEHSSKLTCKDWNDSNVFHHCLGSSNDDETCAGYLNILLTMNDAKSCLLQCNFTGDIPLSIAAMETKNSRICSILSLLKHGSKSMITTINDDGRSPLQLCIRSLKGRSAYIELECCVRVILLLLYGGSPDNKSDKNDIAIEECEFDPVKDILSNPKDGKVMTNALDSILKKLKESNAISETMLTFSEEISLDIQNRIIEATKILKSGRIDGEI
nr:uncharacterized protein LOC111104129 isoform X2 [Crassostrea virginica]XP_022293623.1 uncharacterized protein LOC111104129 isoform X2 [Crassostrea virginica]XP_022293624.1 uncharacterized protein LOC111104129 isoform X2 [Crassostrea virginica]XP_022293625.1 uncharacterized protein LOC111104129 isoform X2 [Crassostrea virginica]